MICVLVGVKWEKTLTEVEIDRERLSSWNKPGMRHSAS